MAYGKKKKTNKQTNKQKQKQKQNKKHPVVTINSFASH